MRWTLGLLAAMTIACGGGGGGGGGGSSSPPKPPAPPPPAPTGVPVVPRTASAPFGVTWNIAFNENVPLATMQAWYARMVALSSAIWDVSEGQVYIAEVVISDGVAPGLTANDVAYGASPPALATLDMMIFVGATWDEPGAGGYVAFDVGRTGRLIGLPDDASDLAIVHEASHMVFDLSWTPGPLLWDEYEDGFQDDACIMETTAEHRWCAGDNHVGQASQPTSCWEQILADYPNFRYAGTNTAPTAAPPTTVEYTDAP